MLHLIKNKKTDLRNNKDKGMTLLEVIISVAILAVLSSILATSWMHMSKQGREKADESALNSLPGTIQSIAQSSETYNLGKSIVEDSTDGYTFNFTLIQTGDFTKVVLNQDGITMTTPVTLNDEGEEDFNDFKKRVIDKYNGQMEPIELISPKYKEIEKLEIFITYPDVPNKVNTEMKMEVPELD